MSTEETAPAVATDIAGVTARRMSDGPVELIISWLLRIGVWTSISTIVLGLVLLIAKDGSKLMHRQPGGLDGLLKQGLPGQPATLSAYGDVLLSVRHGQGLGVVMLGLLVLLLTPVLRVAVSIVAFLVERDVLYVWITIVVLCLLLAGIALGKGGG